MGIRTGNILLSDSRYMCNDQTVDLDVAASELVEPLRFLHDRCFREHNKNGGGNWDYRSGQRCC